MTRSSSNNIELNTAEAATTTAITVVTATRSPISQELFRNVDRKHPTRIASHTQRTIIAVKQFTCFSYIQFVVDNSSDNGGGNSNPPVIHSLRLYAPLPLYADIARPFGCSRSHPNSFSFQCSIHQTTKITTTTMTTPVDDSRTV